MIPTSLKLHNFTAYGPETPELDLCPLRLVVLTGNNGAGKSSVLDAMTWAVWGWSRAGDNADRLVRMGEREMWVEFSFVLHETEYRIVRTRKLGGSGSTTLSFFAKPLTKNGVILNPESSSGQDSVKNLKANRGEILPSSLKLRRTGRDAQDDSVTAAQDDKDVGLKEINLTEGTIKATQQKIIETLHLTYETFINSSYLRQGHADEFTLKGPTDRKKILADILGLSRYELLEEKAKVAAKEAVDKMRLLELQITELDAEVTNSSRHEEEQSRTESELKEIQTQLILSEKTLAEATTRREKQTAMVEIEREKEKQLVKTRVELAEVEKELMIRREELVKLKELVSEKDAVEKGYGELLAMRKDLELLEEVRTLLIRAKDEAARLEAAVSEERLTNESELQRIKAEAGQLKVKLEKDEADLQKAGGENAKCPVCGQELDKQHRVKVVNDLKLKVKSQKEKLEELRIEYKKVSEFHPSKGSELEAKKKEVQELEKKAAPASELRAKLTKLGEFEEKKRELDVAAARESEIKTAGMKLKEQAEKLKSEIEAAGEINLSRLEAELGEISEEVQRQDLVTRQLRTEEGGKKETLAAKIGRAHV